MSARRRSSSAARGAAGRCCFCTAFLRRILCGIAWRRPYDALGNWGSDRTSFPREIRAAYIEALRDPQTVHAICEEYRAAANIDVSRDTDDRRVDRRISCQTLVLWSKGGGLDSWYEETGGPLGIWRDWVADVTGRAISGGHFFPEENPTETISELRSFFRAP
jgi:haloacetate dehalogenase